MSISHCHIVNTDTHKHWFHYTSHGISLEATVGAKFCFPMITAQSNHIFPLASFSTMYPKNEATVSAPLSETLNHALFLFICTQSNA